MGLQIESGVGTGNLASVVDNRLHVSARSQDRIYYISRDHGQAFTFSHSYDYDAADTILLVANNSPDKLFFVHAVIFSSDTSTAWQMHCPAYPTLAGTTITGTNMNRTSGNSANASAIGDETGNTQANVIARGIVLANTTVSLQPLGSIILGYHQCIAVDFTTAGTLAACTIRGWFE